MKPDNCFITLTYNDENLPYGSTLEKTHFQKFMKRLRKKHGAMRYFHCGEYGETTLRPHYHALLFGFRPNDPELFSTEGEIKLYQSKSLENTWGLGHTTFGDLTFESAAYVARYVTKKITGKAAKDHYREIDQETGEIYDRQPEYCTMSRRPGLGTKWLQQYGVDSYQKDEVILRRKSMRPPRAYDKIFEHTDPKLWSTVSENRENRRLKKYGEKISTNGPSPDDPEEQRRLHAGNVIALQKLKTRQIQ